MSKLIFKNFNKNCKRNFEQEQGRHRKTREIIQQLAGNSYVWRERDLEIFMCCKEGMSTEYLLWFYP